ncbi:unnamed protein product [Ectocarpus sp. 12 AP-2014]
MVCWRVPCSKRQTARMKSRWHKPGCSRKARLAKVSLKTRRHKPGSFRYRILAKQAAAKAMMLENTGGFWARQDPTVARRPQACNRLLCLCTRGSKAPQETLGTIFLGGASLKNPTPDGWMGTPAAGWC